MPSGARHKLCLAAALALAATVLPACGSDDATEGFARGINKARQANALGSITQALTTASLVTVEAGGQPADLVSELQSRDPSNRYTVDAPSEPGVVQVMGGGSSPLMLVAVNGASNSSEPAQYVAAWQSGGTVLYYKGPQPPQYATGQPAGAGWGSAPPQ